MSYNINTQFQDYSKNMISEQKYKDYLNIPLEENRALFDSNVKNLNNLKSKYESKNNDTYGREIKDNKLIINNSVLTIRITIFFIILILFLIYKYIV